MLAHPVAQQSPIFFPSFLFKCIALKLECLNSYLLQGWMLSAPRKGEWNREWTNSLFFYVMNSIIFLDLLYIPYCSNLKHIKGTSVMHWNSECCKDIWEGSHWVLLKIPTKFFITELYGNGWDSERHLNRLMCFGNQLVIWSQVCCDVCRKVSFTNCSWMSWTLNIFFKVLAICIH